MATKETMKKIICAFYTNYEFFGSKSNPESIFALWWNSFSDYPDNVLNEASRTVLKSCKKAPTIADMHEAIHGTESVFENVVPLWNEFVTAYKKGRYYATYLGYKSAYIDLWGNPSSLTQAQHAELAIKEVYRNLSEPIRKYIGDEYAFFCLVTEGNLSDYEKTRFFKEMPALVSRELKRNNGAMAPELVSRADEVAREKLMFEAFVPQE